MVYVSHNADYRRTLHHLAHVLFILLKKFLNHIHLYFLFAHNVVLDGDIFRFLIGNFRIQRYDLACQEEFFNDNGRLHLHLVGKFLDGQLLRQHNHLDLLFHGRLFLLRFDKTSGFVLQCALLFLFVNHILSGSFVSVLIYAAFFVLGPFLCRSRLCIHTKAFPLPDSFSGSCVSAIRSSTAPVIMKRFIPSSAASLTLLTVLITRTAAAFISPAFVPAADSGPVILPLPAAVFPALELASLTASWLIASLPIVCAR